jgi:hypothetical protein
MRAQKFFAPAAPVLFMAIAPAAWAIPMTVQYQATSLGANQWSYAYTVSNNSLAEPVREFTVWFDQSLFRNLQVASPNPPSAGWSELVVQPDLVIQDDGFYDALSLGAGIAAGTQVPGFSVRFEWIGSGQPGSQPFEVVDPATFTTIYRDFTVPEPATALSTVAMAGVLLARAGKRVRRN